MLNIQGIFPPLPTAFNHDESVSDTFLQKNIQWLNAYDLSGYLVLGSNGENVLLTQAEKIELLRAAREAIPTGKLLIAGTGCESTKETIWLSNEAAAAGADAVLILNPFYFKGQMNHEALVVHYHSVAEESRVPVIIYNMPSNTGIDMTADTILAISAHQNIIGLKDSGGNIAKMAEIIHKAKPQFQVLAGSAGFLLPALSIGAVGGVLALANIAPQHCLDIYQAFLKNDMTQAASLQQQIIALNAAVTRNWGVPALKSAMDHIGLYGGPCRKPLLPLPDHLNEALIKLMKR